VDWDGMPFTQMTTVEHQIVKLYFQGCTRGQITDILLFVKITRRLPIRLAREIDRTGYDFAFAVKWQLAPASGSRIPDCNLCKTRTSLQQILNRTLCQSSGLREEGTMGT
jgi:hypothetical protein